MPAKLTEAFPRAPVIVVICDSDSIHHARAVTAHLDDHPRLELLCGARYNPHDNPVERIWAALKNYVANTAVTWPGRLRQIHSFSRNRSPSQIPVTAAPWTSLWLPAGYEQNIWNAAASIMALPVVRVHASGRARDGLRREVVPEQIPQDSFGFLDHGGERPGAVLCGYREHQGCIG